jgi:hypothetical protein
MTKVSRSQVSAIGLGGHVAKGEYEEDGVKMKRDVGQ